MGRDFPVFLHPDTAEEYALARTERKTGAGYHGFVFHADPSVTLEQDLARRDLTINAMARGDDGVVVDPYGGQRDLAAKLLRHIGPSFEEDPVRILRLARFAARWPDFEVAPDTLALCRRMVAAGEVAALVAERVWQELSRGLMEVAPSRMLQVLRDCGALAVLLPEVDRLYGVPCRAASVASHVGPRSDEILDGGRLLERALDTAARLHASLPVRYACWVQHLGMGTTPVSEWPEHSGHADRSVQLQAQLAQRWRVPTECRELGDVVAREAAHIHASGLFGPAELVGLFTRCDAWRRPQRFEQVLFACECDARACPGLEDCPYLPRPCLTRLLCAVQSVDVGAVAQQAQSEAVAAGDRKGVGERIARAVTVAREAAVAAALATIK